MNLIYKTVMAGAISLVCLSSFAQSSSSGIDPSGEGVIHITGTAVGSCKTQDMVVHFGEMDAHVAANGPTGVYEHNIDISVQCTNPNQNWSVLPYTVQTNISDGFENPNINNNGVAFISVSPRATTAGIMFTESDLMNGIGTSTVAAKLMLGQDVPGLDRDNYDYFSLPVGKGIHYTEMATPTGTVGMRGQFSAGIPLIIMY